MDILDIWLGRAVSRMSGFVLPIDLVYKKQKIGPWFKGIVSCDGGASKEGHPHTSI